MRAARPTAAAVIALGAAAALAGCGTASSPAATPGAPAVAPVVVATTTVPATTTTTAARSSARDPFAQLTSSASAATTSAAAPAPPTTASKAPASSSTTAAAPTGSSSSSPSTSPVTQPTQAQQVLTWWEATVPRLEQLVRQENRALAAVATGGRNAVYRHDGTVLTTTARTATLPCPVAAVAVAWQDVLDAYVGVGLEAAAGQFVSPALVLGVTHSLVAMKAALVAAGLVFHRT